jgi:hypothetical protein
VSPRPGGQLSRIRLVRPDDLGDPVIVVVEDVMEQEGGSLLGAERLQDDQKGQGEGVRQLRLAGRVVLGALGDRLR